MPIIIMKKKRVTSTGNDGDQPDVCTCQIGPRSTAKRSKIDR